MTTSLDLFCRGEYHDAMKLTRAEYERLHLEGKAEYLATLDPNEVAALFSTSASPLGILSTGPRSMDYAPRIQQIQKIERRIDLNGWLLLLILILLIPAWLWIRQQWSLVPQTSPVNAPVAVAMPSPQTPAPGAMVTSAPPPPVETPAPAIATPAASAAQPHPAKAIASATLPKEKMRKVTYTVNGNPYGAVEVYYHLPDGTPDGKWTRVMVNTGWTIKFDAPIGADVSLSASNPTLTPVELSAQIYLDGTIWKRDERYFPSGSAHVNVTGIVRDFP
jgi:hypothetical protein